MTRDAAADAGTEAPAVRADRVTRADAPASPVSPAGTGPAPAAVSWQEVAAGEVVDSRPLLVVHGNCQAESLRVLLSGALGEQVRSVRVPPVFELTADDVGPFQALLARTSLLVTQPVVDDYRGLPLGHRQVRAQLPASARSVAVPVLRWAALHPTHAIVRAPGVGDPPVVPYHDLRILAAASRGAADVDLSVPSAEAVRQVREISRAALLIRQETHGTVDAVSAFEQAGADATWTINHPTNAVLLEVAARALEALGMPVPVPDPGRTLLATTTAPMSEAVLAALDLPGMPRTGWLHQGRAISEEEVATAHLTWYRRHPEVVAAGLTRHRDTLEALDLL